MLCPGQFILVESVGKEKQAIGNRNVGFIYTVETINSEEARERLRDERNISASNS